MEDVIEIDLIEIWHIIIKKLWIILAATLACMTISTLYTKLLIPEKFESYATMIVNTRQDQSASVTNDQINSAKQLVLTYSYILKSDTILDKVIDNLNLTNIEGFESITSKKLSEDIVNIQQVDTTQVMRITATTIDPTISSRIVSEIVKLAPNMIISTVKAGSVEVISYPKPNYQKVSPSLTKNALIGAFLGMMVSTGIIILLALLDNTVKTDEDITKRLGLLVIGVIPSIEER